MLAPWKKSGDKPRQQIKKQRHHFANKGPYSQSYVFSNSHVWIWGLDYKEGWVPNNWCFQIVLLQKTPETLLGSEEIKPVNPKGNQPWIIIERTDAEASILWPLDAESRWKRPWCWKGLKVRGEGDNRGQDGWMASPTQWTWVSANSKRTGKPGVLQSMEVTKSWTQLSIWTTTKPQFKKKTQMRGCSLMKNINPKTGKGYQESD